MQINIKARNFTLPDAIRIYITRRLAFTFFSTELGC